MRKKCKVVFIDDDVENAFNRIDENDKIKKSILKAVINLKENAFSGIQIPKRLIPKCYVKRYMITNLWKYNLLGGWRLLYTIAAEDEAVLICAILEWFSHKDYERRMKY